MSDVELFRLTERVRELERGPSAAVLQQRLVMEEEARHGLCDIVKRLSERVTQLEIKVGQLKLGQP